MVAQTTIQCEKWKRHIPSLIPGGSRTTAVNYVINTMHIFT